MYDIHFHTIEPVYSNKDFKHDISTAVDSDFQVGHFNKEEDPFWFGVTVPFDKEISDTDLDELKESVSAVLYDIPTIWSVSSITRDKPQRLIFLVDVRGPLGR